MTEEAFIDRVRSGAIADELAVYRAVAQIEPPVRGILPDLTWNNGADTRAFGLIPARGRILHLQRANGTAFMLRADEEIR